MAFLFLTMIFMHILDDFVLQKLGCLAMLKQKSWWVEQKEYKPIYKYDYLVALAMHSFSWAFMIMLPIAFNCDFNVSSWFAIVFCVNAIVHFIVDNLKANCGAINLVIDQTIHIIQIVCTAIILV